jgi:hypothetical protein
MKQSGWVRTLLFTAVSLLAATSAVAEEPPEIMSDPWLWAPSDMDSPVWQNVEPERVHLVHAEHESEAEALLETAGIIELDAAQAEHFIGAPLPRIAGAHPYLIRAVAFTPVGGKFILRRDGGRLWVAHGMWSHTHLPAHHRALVVLLDNAPTELFVSSDLNE